MSRRPRRITKRRTPKQRNCRPVDPFKDLEHAFTKFGVRLLDSLLNTTPPAAVAAAIKAAPTLERDADGVYRPKKEPGK